MFSLMEVKCLLANVLKSFKDLLCFRSRTDVYGKTKGLSSEWYLRIFYLIELFFVEPDIFFLGFVLNWSFKIEVVRRPRQDFSPRYHLLADRGSGLDSFLDRLN